MATRSQIRSTSDRTWVEKTTVASPRRPGDQLEQVAPSLRIERADRLVEEQDVGPVEERLGDPQPLAHAARVATDPALARRGQADPRQHLVDARRGARTPPARGAGRRARAARVPSSSCRSAGPGRGSRPGDAASARRGRPPRRPRTRCPTSGGRARSGSGSSSSCPHRWDRAGRRPSRAGPRDRAGRAPGSRRTASTVRAPRSPGRRVGAADAELGRAALTPPPARRRSRGSGRPR